MSLTLAAQAGKKTFYKLEMDKKTWEVEVKDYQVGEIRRLVTTTRLMHQTDSGDSEGDSTSESNSTTDSSEEYTARVRLHPSTSALNRHRGLQTFNAHISSLDTRDDSNMEPYTGHTDRSWYIVHVVELTDEVIKHFTQTGHQDQLRLLLPTGLIKTDDLIIDLFLDYFSFSESGTSGSGKVILRTYGVDGQKIAETSLPVEARIATSNEGSVYLSSLSHEGNENTPSQPFSLTFVRQELVDDTTLAEENRVALERENDAQVTVNNDEQEPDLDSSIPKIPDDGEPTAANEQAQPDQEDKVSTSGDEVDVNTIPPGEEHLPELPGRSPADDQNRSPFTGISNLSGK
ncbi:hypothetical protein [Endozoicomonas euniceicola]|uniref:Uncharacterized protein n=1 Tax=Endozoicomonas euniceicola TaxID=1234143 RepID=A0ABY6GVR2_9GAMM|nr:hypothetical protein [Endozoicomonas euniceicola]UYM16069.1 hypothetical protein NX720_25260 [Endozoicomonas euniceicola]